MIHLCIWFQCLDDCNLKKKLSKTPDSTHHPNDGVYLPLYRQGCESTDNKYIRTLANPSFFPVKPKLVQHDALQLRLSDAVDIRALLLRHCCYTRSLTD